MLLIRSDCGHCDYKNVCKYRHSLHTLSEMFRNHIEEFQAGYDKEAFCIEIGCRYFKSEEEK